MITFHRKIGTLYTTIVGDNDVFKVEVLDEFTPTWIKLTAIDSTSAIKNGDYFIDSEKKLFERTSYSFTNLNDPSKPKVVYYPGSIALTVALNFYPFVTMPERYNEIGTIWNLSLVVFKGKSIAGKNLEQATLHMTQFVVDNSFTPKRIILHPTHDDPRVTIGNIFHTCKSMTFKDHCTGKDVQVSYPDIKIALIIGVTPYEQPSESKLDAPKFCGVSIN